MQQRSFETAHLNIMDLQVVVVFVSQCPPRELYDALERSAQQAGLTGELVAVWPDEMGRTRFLAPQQMHAFFRMVGYDQLRAQVNTTLQCPC
ncbi:MAG TPA: hypothetical protein VGP62_07285 [Bryobacteraceae bacterium]|jgi:hypothetical protein|nr:hypothetical protein [Bryobacteraceae bacterium]